jgi:hypothetical protein
MRQCHVIHDATFLNCLNVDWVLSGRLEAECAAFILLFAHHHIFGLLRLQALAK